jgi:hypothetical protein
MTPRCPSLTFELSDSAWPGGRTEQGGWAPTGSACQKVGFFTFQTPTPSSVSFDNVNDALGDVCDGVIYASQLQRA